MLDPKTRRLKRREAQYRREYKKKEKAYKREVKQIHKETRKDLGKESLRWAIILGLGIFVAPLIPLLLTFLGAGWLLWFIVRIGKEQEHEAHKRYFGQEG